MSFLSRNYEVFLKQMVELPIWELREACGVISGCTGFDGFLTYLGNCLSLRQTEQLNGRQEVYSGPWIEEKYKVGESYKSSRARVDVEKLFDRFVKDAQSGEVLAELFDVSDLPKDHFPSPLSYCAPPQIFLFWAVERGIRLPEGLQALSGLRQIATKGKVSKPEKKKIKMQVEAIHKWMEDSSFTIESMAAAFQPYYGYTNKTTRLALGSIDPRPADQSKGRPTSRKTVTLHWKCHSELVVQNGENLFYDFPRLKLFLEAHIIKLLLHNTYHSCLQIIRSPTIAPYFESAPKLVQEWIFSVIYVKFYSLAVSEALMNLPETFPISHKTP